MTKEQVRELYANLNRWVDSGIGDDIVQLKDQRPEYQPYVERARKEGKSDQEIPQAVLWMLREEYNRLSKVETQDTEKQTEKNVGFVHNSKGKFAIGTKAGPGRPKGIKNKQNLTLIAGLAKIDFYIAEEAVALYRRTRETTTKFAILQFLTQYCYPKIKDIEKDVEDGDIEGEETNLADAVDDES